MRHDLVSNLILQDKREWSSGRKVERADGSHESYVGVVETNVNQMEGFTPPATSRQLLSKVISNSK